MSKDKIIENIITVIALICYWVGVLCVLYLGYFVNSAFLFVAAPFTFVGFLMNEKAIKSMKQVKDGEKDGRICR